MPYTTVMQDTGLWFSIHSSKDIFSITIHEGYLEDIQGRINRMPDAKYLTDEEKAANITKLTTIRKMSFSTSCYAGTNQVEIMWRKIGSRWGNHTIAQKDWVECNYHNLEWQFKFLGKLVRKITRLAGVSGPIKPHNSAYRLNGVEGIVNVLAALQAMTGRNHVSPTRVIILPGSDVGTRVRCTWKDIHDLTFEARHPERAKVGA